MSVRCFEHGFGKLTDLYGAKSLKPQLEPVVLEAGNVSHIG